MQKIDGNYLYQVGSQIHPLSSFSAFRVGGGATTLDEAHYPIIVAEQALEPLLNRSVFRLRTSWQAGQALLNKVREIKAQIIAASDRTMALNMADIFEVQSLLSSFEAVLGAELGQLPLYVVTQKAGFIGEPLAEDRDAAVVAEIDFFAENDFLNCLQLNSRLGRVRVPCEEPLHDVVDHQSCARARAQRRCTRRDAARDGSLCGEPQSRA